MDSKIIIRKGVLSDIPALINLLRDLFSIEKDFSFNKGKQEKGLGMILKANPEDSILLVADKDGMAIGMCSAQTMVSTAEGGLAVMMEDMIVRKDERGRGIGVMLLKGIEKWADNNGITRFQLLADKNNLAALAFYGKNEWKRTRLICLRKMR